MALVWQMYRLYCDVCHNVNEFIGVCQTFIPKSQSVQRWLVIVFANHSEASWQENSALDE